MLFNSPGFLFVFLPVLLFVFFQLGRYQQRWAIAWLTLGSLFFYGWWNPVYVLLLLASILFNYLAGCALARWGELGSLARKRWLLVGVAGNLLLLGYFKYANFFQDTAHAIFGTPAALADTVLPLGISFFTFTQIAFLVDVAAGKAHEPQLLHYALFVSYYPHLIAGPVLHHKEMMPQFAQAASYRLRAEFLGVGLTVFALGLFKKTVLADGIAPFAGPAFVAAAQGQALGLLQAWSGVLAYTLQLYFDFSGYSDMAIGLSYLIGVRLPLNFNSPYKARNISDFWRRWHMTLSRFLRDYLYIPLGGNQKGPLRRHANLMATMLLGGLWHGAGWTFVVWGGLHGLALVTHQCWRALRLRLGQDPDHSSRAGRVAATALTFLLVVLGWVFFRSSSLGAAMDVLRAMCGLQGVSLPSGIGLRLGALGRWLTQQGVQSSPGGGHELVMGMLWIGSLLPVVFLAPNTQQIMQHFAPALVPGDGVTDSRLRLRWRASTGWALALALVLATGLLSLSRPAEFLYFQF